MEKFIFYVGFKNQDETYKHERIFREIEMEQGETQAKKLLHILKEIVNYLTTGHNYDK